MREKLEKREKNVKRLAAGKIFPSLPKNYKKSATNSTLTK